MSTYKVEYHPSVLKEDIKDLSNADLKRVKKAIEQKLTTNPIVFGKPLRYSLKGARSLRVGTIRVIFTIESKTILILKIGHRKKVYQ